MASRSMRSLGGELCWPWCADGMQAGTAQCCLRGTERFAAADAGVDVNKLVLFEHWDFAFAAPTPEELHGMSL